MELPDPEANSFKRIFEKGSYPFCPGMNPMLLFIQDLPSMIADIGDVLNVYKRSYFSGDRPETIQAAILSIMRFKKRLLKR
jgi:hypothetical protein